MEHVVEGKWVQGFPPLMPRQVEVHLQAEEAAPLREAFSRGDLFVRIDSPEGERVHVKGLWVNPHDPLSVTLFLEG